jgi:methyltransferase (TIGR00027 family)
MSDLGQGVSATAVAAAAARAVESSRADRLVEDPFARLLVEAADVPMRFPLLWPDDLRTVPPQQLLLLIGSGYVGLRTRFIDDWLGRSPTGQVVLLGAGLDTRAYRLAWGVGATVFEVDRVHVLAFTDRVLAAAGFTPACACHNVPVDVADDWQDSLRVSGLDVTGPVTWIVEGLLPHLADALQRSLFEGIVSLSAPGSRAVLERAVTLPETPETIERLTAAGTDVPAAMAGLLDRSPTDPAALLADAGWEVEEHSVSEISETYHRPLVDPCLAAALRRGRHAPHPVPHHLATVSASTAPVIGEGFVTARLPLPADLP